MTPIMKHISGGHFRGCFKSLSLRQVPFESKNNCFDDLGMKGLYGAIVPQDLLMPFMIASLQLLQVANT